MGVYITKTLLGLIFPVFLLSINPQDLTHSPNNILYVNPAAGEIRLRVKMNTVDKATLILKKNVIAMQSAFSDGGYDYFLATTTPFDSTAGYFFVLKYGNDTLIYPAGETLYARVPYYTTPEWAKGISYYSIFLDGFYNGLSDNDRPPSQAWESSPKPWHSYGGDLRGLITKIPYLDSLNIDAVIIQPITLASSNHKYNAREYSLVDSAFGDTLVLKDAINQLHNRDIKVLMSLVFTHTGNDFAAFNDVITNQLESRYANWYLVDSWPIKTSPPSYQCWLNDHRFPRLNLANSQVINYAIGYVEYWRHFGFDGFYIGENESIDPLFAKMLRNYVKPKAQNILLIGSDDRVVSGYGFDGVRNKNLTNLLRNFFIDRKLSVSEFDLSYRRLLFFKPPQVNTINLISVSDFSGRFWKDDHDDLVRLMFAFIFTSVGSPVLFYGDEVGYRKAVFLNPGSFPWDANNQDRILYYDIQSLIEIRRNNPQLRSSNFYPLYVNDINRVYAYDRGGIIIALNCDNNPSYIELPAWNGTYIDLINGEKIFVSLQKLRITVEARSFRILK